MKKIIRLGTRGSPLALIQAQIVRDQLYAAHGLEARSFDIEIVPIRTSGDWTPGSKEQTFLELGGTKGLFTKEIEEAILSNTIDMAVHSMKDVSIRIPVGLKFEAILLRDDPRDAFLSVIAPTVSELPKGARVGTSSLRRKAQILAMRPDLTVIPLRGNVDTRLKKLAAEEADATILAVAGLSRLGVLDRASSIFDCSVLLPAAAQGFLGIQIREDDPETALLVRPINHRESELCCLAERAVLDVLDGSCRTPIAAHATIDATGTMNIEALVAKMDGSEIIRRKLSGPSQDAVKLGQEVGGQVKKEIPEDFFASC